MLGNLHLARLVSPLLIDSRSQYFMSYSYPYVTCSEFRIATAVWLASSTYSIVLAPAQRVPVEAPAIGGVWGFSLICI
jgi:hypothetical protein